MVCLKELSPRVFGSQSLARRRCSATPVPRNVLVCRAPGQGVPLFLSGRGVRGADIDAFLADTDRRFVGMSSSQATSQVFSH